MYGCGAQQMTLLPKGIEISGVEEQVPGGRDSEVLKKPASSSCVAPGIKQQADF